MAGRTRDRVRIEAIEAELRRAYRAVERQAAPADFLDIVAQLEAQAAPEDQAEAA